MCSVTINITPNSPPLTPYTVLQFYSVIFSLLSFVPYLFQLHQFLYIFRITLWLGYVYEVRGETRGCDETCAIYWSKDMRVPFYALVSLRLHVDRSLLSSTIPYCIAYRAAPSYVIVPSF